MRGVTTAQILRKLHRKIGLGFREKYIMVVVGNLKCCHYLVWLISALTQHLQHCSLGLISATAHVRGHQTLSSSRVNHHLPAHDGVHHHQRDHRDNKEHNGGELVEVGGHINHGTECG